MNMNNECIDNNGMGREVRTDKEVMIIDRVVVYSRGYSVRDGS